MKTSFGTLVLALALSSPLSALAQPPEAAPVAALNDGLIATMKAGSAGQSFPQRQAALDQVVRQSFNLPVLGQNSVGLLWSTLPASQQQQLASLFEVFTVASYVSEFTSYSGEHFNILPTEKQLAPNQKIIETQLVPGDGSTPTELDYVSTQGPDGWQITDVLLDGTISQVAVHASDFSSLVTSGDATPLITALKTKITTLSNGTVTP